MSAVDWGHPAFPGLSFGTGPWITLGQWADVADNLFFQWMFQSRHQWNKTCTASLASDLHSRQLTPRVCAVLASCLKANLVVFGNVDGKVGMVFKGSSPFQLFCADDVYNKFRPHVAWEIEGQRLRPVLLSADRWHAVGSQHPFVTCLSSQVCAHMAAREGLLRQQLELQSDKISLDDLQEHCRIKRVPLFKPGSRASTPFVFKTKSELLDSARRAKSVQLVNHANHSDSREIKPTHLATSI